MQKIENHMLGCLTNPDLLLSLTYFCKCCRSCFTVFQMKTKTSTFVFSSSKHDGQKKMNSIRNHQVCPLVVHMAAASSPSGWSGHALCSHSQPQKSSWAGQNVPCMSNKSLCVGWPAIPICWCRRVQCRCTWTEDALADCGCCICPSSLLGDEENSFEIWTNRDKETAEKQPLYIGYC